MQYNNLKNKAIELLVHNGRPFSFAGEMPNGMKQLFINMADEIGCLKARVEARSFSALSTQKISKL